MRNVQRKRERESERARELEKEKKICIVNKSGSRRENYPVIYIFHKYSLSREKVKTRKEGAPGAPLGERAREKSGREREGIFG